MKTNVPTCLSCPMNRRGFLAKGSAAGLGALAMLGAPATSVAQPANKITIRVVYALHAEQQTGPDWPNAGFDFGPIMRRIDAELTAKCSGFEFLISRATGEEQAKALLAQDQAAGNVDGYLVYQMNCWNRVVQTFAASGKPVLYADFQFGGSGGFLVYTASFLRAQAQNVAFVASSRPQDLIAAIKCFHIVKQGGTSAEFVAAVTRLRLKATPVRRSLPVTPDTVQCLDSAECLSRLKQTKLLAVRDQNAGPGESILGVQVQFIPFAELNQAWESADREHSRAIAEGWAKKAAAVREVSKQTLEESAGMYLAEKALLEKHRAQGITVNCLGGFYGGHIHAYPCLGFHQLNSDGLVGGCECDLRSAATMLTGSVLTQGRPGYISDPVLDTARRQIIYAHCVAHNKPFGPAGRANPFEILTHSEDRKGASIRSLLPRGYLTTSLQLEPARKEILMHQALAVGNDPDDRACRTKLCGQPLGDFEKLFRMWDQWGWHRATFYGDLKEPVQALAETAGWRVIQEA